MALPTDARFQDQWYLRNTAAGEYDLDVVKAWDDVTGKGVRVFVIDSGLDYANPDLAPNFDLADSYDYSDQDADPAAQDKTGNFGELYSDNHATPVAGLIAAAADNGGVVGVAYEATLVSYRLGVQFFPYDLIAKSLCDAVDKGADIVNMSFGNIYQYLRPSWEVRALSAATNYLVEHGRDGLGAIAVKAAGNTRGSWGVDINSSGTESDTHAIIVAAVDRNGSVSSYSAPGAAILVSAFGSSGDITTTDRTGSLGYNTAPDDPGIVSTFDGTSAAAPMVSGIVALMLQANPDLGWRDVQTILAYSARHVGTDIGYLPSGTEINPWSFNGATTWNGGGLHYSADYGFGLVDAGAAVRLAETWTESSTSANEIKRYPVLLNADTPVTLPDHDLAGVTYTLDNTLSMDVERMVVSVDFGADDTSDLRVYLIAPDGRKVRMIGGVEAGDPSTETHGSVSLGDGPFRFSSQALRGVSGRGEWTVQIMDAGSSGSASDPSTVEIKSVRLSMFGSAVSRADTYVYTDEFSDYAGRYGHLKTLNDTNGGYDTINASAVTTASTINLSQGTGKIDGVVISIAGIENVDGGDADDTLVGNGFDNILSGGRGRDELTGGAGDDTFLYRTTRDSSSTQSRDVITDFATGDHIGLSAIDAGSAAGDQAFAFIGTNTFDGNAGELRFALLDRRDTSDDRTVVLADVDGDKVADFQIELTGLHHLTKGDFIL